MINLRIDDDIDALAEEEQKLEPCTERNNGVASDRRLSPANIRKNCYCQSSVTSQNS